MARGHRSNGDCSSDASHSLSFSFSGRACHCASVKAFGSRIPATNRATTVSTMLAAADLSFFQAVAVGAAHVDTNSWAA